MRCKKAQVARRQVAPGEKAGEPITPIWHQILNMARLDAPKILFGTVLLLSVVLSLHHGMVWYTVQVHYIEVQFGAGQYSTGGWYVEREMPLLVSGR